MSPWMVLTACGGILTCVLWYMSKEWMGVIITTGGFIRIYIYSRNHEVGIYFPFPHQRVTSHKFASKYTRWSWAPFFSAISITEMFCFRYIPQSISFWKKSWWILILFSSAIRNENSRRRLFLFVSSTSKLAEEIWEKGKLAGVTFPGGLKTLDECKFSASRKEYEYFLPGQQKMREKEGCIIFFQYMGEEDIEMPPTFLAARFRLH